MLTGFIPATSGNVIICGYDIFEKPHEVKKRVGYLPENPPLYRDMTVEEYLDFVASIKGMNRGNKKRRIGKSSNNSVCRKSQTGHPEALKRLPSARRIGSGR